MTGGGGKPRRGKMQLGSGPPKGVVAAAAASDGKETAALQSDVHQLQEVRTCLEITWTAAFDARQRR